VRWLLALVATLAFAPSAYAQGASVQWVGDTVPWSPAEVTIKAGESVTWTWSNAHNVRSTAGPWDVTSPDTTSPFTHTFGEPGTYDYVCQFHAAMTGRVIVTDAGGTPPPPPPPPPPSEQPWPNDQQPPTVFELTDQKQPRLTRVRVAGVRHGVRVRFRLSERARVIVRFKLGGVAVRTARKTFGAGPGRLTVRNRRMHGRYRLDVFARDLSGNRSRIKHARVTMR
jgi:plastocyanin